jgi:hypothetical protein
LTYYSPGEWQRGELLKAYYDLPLSPDLPASDYALAISVDQNPSITIATIHVTR